MLVLHPLYCSLSLLAPTLTMKGWNKHMKERRHFSFPLLYMSVNLFLPAKVAPEYKPTTVILIQIWNSFLRCKCIGEFQYYIIDVGREKSHLYYPHFLPHEAQINKTWVFPYSQDINYCRPILYCAVSEDRLISSPFTRLSHAFCNFTTCCDLETSIFLFSRKI